MGDQGGDGGVSPAPPTVPPRGASRAVLLEQRKIEVQDAAVVGALVKVVYAEAWTTRAGEAMPSGYGSLYCAPILDCPVGEETGGCVVCVIPYPHPVHGRRCTQRSRPVGFPPPRLGGQKEADSNRSHALGLGGGRAAARARNRAGQHAADIIDSIVQFAEYRSATAAARITAIRRLKGEATDLASARARWPARGFCTAATTAWRQRASSARRHCQSTAQAWAAAACRRRRACPHKGARPLAHAAARGGDRSSTRSSRDGRHNNNNNNDKQHRAGAKAAASTPPSASACGRGVKLAARSPPARHTLPRSTTAPLIPLTVPPTHIFARSLVRSSPPATCASGAPRATRTRAATAAPARLPPSPSPRAACRASYTANDPTRFNST